MNRVFIVIGVIVVCVVGLGFYFGHFRISSETADGQTHITLTVDQRRMKDGETKVVQQLQDVGNPEND